MDSIGSILCLNRKLTTANRGNIVTSREFHLVWFSQSGISRGHQKRSVLVVHSQSKFEV